MLLFKCILEDCDQRSPPGPRFGPGATCGVCATPELILSCELRVVAGRRELEELYCVVDGLWLCSGSFLLHALAIVNGRFW